MELWYHRYLNTPASLPYKRHRFGVEIISHAVWLYFRFSLRYRDVEDLMAARGILLWHLDEVFRKITGKLHELWRAVDRQGNVLDILLQKRRNKGAAKKFFRKLLKGCQYVPHVLMSDKLGSYAAAKQEMLPNVEHRMHKRLNNQAENSHQGACMRSAKSDGSRRHPSHSAKARLPNHVSSHESRPNTAPDCVKSRNGGAAYPWGCTFSMLSCVEMGRAVIQTIGWSRSVDRPKHFHTVWHCS